MFFMIKREKRRFEPIELLNFIHDEQLKRLKTEKTPKPKRIFRRYKRKIFVDPNQMNFAFI